MVAPVLAWNGGQQLAATDVAATAPRPSVAAADGADRDRCAVVNSVLSFLQTLIYGRAVARTELNRAPIFILGHWRSGTTYLHELLVLDERFAFPTTYECFAPTTFCFPAACCRSWSASCCPRSGRRTTCSSASTIRRRTSLPCWPSALQPDVANGLPQRSAHAHGDAGHGGGQRAGVLRWKQAIFGFSGRRRISKANRWSSSRRRTPAASGCCLRCSRKRSSSTSCGTPIRCFPPRGVSGMRWSRYKASRCRGTNISTSTSSRPSNGCIEGSSSNVLSSTIRASVTSATKTSSRIRWVKSAHLRAARTG